MLQSIVLATLMLSAIIFQALAGKQANYRMYIRSLLYAAVDFSISKIIINIVGPDSVLNCRTYGNHPCMCSTTHSNGIVIKLVIVLNLKVESKTGMTCHNHYRKLLRGSFYLLLVYFHLLFCCVSSRMHPSLHGSKHR